MCAGQPTHGGKMRVAGTVRSASPAELTCEKPPWIPLAEAVDAVAEAPVGLADNRLEASGESSECVAAESSTNSTSDALAGDTMSGSSSLMPQNVLPESTVTPAPMAPPAAPTATSGTAWPAVMLDAPGARASSAATKSDFSNRLDVSTPKRVARDFSSPIRTRGAGSASAAMARSDAEEAIVFTTTDTAHMYKI
eukprot:scaffold12100_cov141-Isochrysis_galbana.AAC.1